MTYFIALATRSKRPERDAAFQAKISPKEAREIIADRARKAASRSGRFDLVAKAMKEVDRMSDSDAQVLARVIKRGLVR